MFTGIIQNIGSVVSYINGELEISTSLDLSDCKIGSSICCNGVCLTATEINYKDESEQINLIKKRLEFHQEGLQIVIKYSTDSEKEDYLNCDQNFLNEISIDKEGEYSFLNDTKNSYVYDYQHISSKELKNSISTWTDEVKSFWLKIKNKNKKIAVWGCSAKFLFTYSALELKFIQSISYIIDSTPEKNNFI